jgi:hypothetical protein
VAYSRLTFALASDDLALLRVAFEFLLSEPRVAFEFLLSEPESRQVL